MSDYWDIISAVDGFLIGFASQKLSFLLWGDEFDVEDRRKQEAKEREQRKVEAEREAERRRIAAVEEAKRKEEEAKKAEEMARAKQTKPPLSSFGTCLSATTK